MKAVRRIGIGLVSLSFAVACWNYFPGNREPKHQGKPVSYWMMQTRSTALEANPGLAAIGTNAIPFLAAALHTKESYSERFLRAIGPKFSPVFRRVLPKGMTREAAANVRHKAVLSLLAFGDEASPALPALESVLNDEDLGVRDNALDCIAEIGPRKETIPLLIAAWNSTNSQPEQIRHSLVANLERAASLNPEAVLPTLVRALNDPDAQVRARAALALANIRRPAPDAVIPLTSMLAELDQQCRVSAALALSRVATPDDKVLAILRRLQNDTNSYVRGSVTLTLWRLTGDSNSAVKALLDQLNSESGREFAAQCLGEMGSAAKPAVPDLWKVLESYPAERGRIDRMAPAVKLRVTEAIARIDPPSPEAALAMAQVMNDAPWLMSQVIASLGNLGPVAEPAVPTIQNALDQTNRFIRRVAKEALAQIRRPSNQESEGR